MEGNVLYYGDNLDILREHIPDDSIDLVYLDPPFSSNQSYNVLFREENGTASAAQVHAFKDTWHWNQGSEDTLTDMIGNAPSNLVDLMNGLLSFLGRNQFTAYLVMMAPRLLELHRVLRSTGSLYLHCDPTASHYLKIILDQVFGVKSFRNEIVWKRTSGHSDATKFACVHDVILYYSKLSSIWNKQYQPHDEEYVKSHYRHADADGRRWMDGDLTVSTLWGGRYEYEWKGVTKVWRCPETTMERYDREQRLYYTRNGTPRLKRYLDESKGRAIGDLWGDINPINSQSKERLGYPTQKPEILLERIISASSNEGDIVLDPFCGCGTAIAVAERLNRQWMGIDITHLAIALMRSRLEDTFGDTVNYEVVGEPKDVSGASALAQHDRYQFEWWALSLVRARPVDQKKKGADKGIDGVKFINTTPLSKRATMVKMIVQVKSGKVGVKDIREFRTVIDNAKAQMGAFLTLNRPTQPMVKEALTAGHYTPKVLGAIQSPKVQILTIEELLSGKTLQTPLHVDMTYRRARKVEEEQVADQPGLFKE